MIADFLRQAHEGAVHRAIRQDFHAAKLVLEIDRTGDQIVDRQRRAVVQCGNRISGQERARIENVAGAAAHCSVIRAAETALVCIGGISALRCAERVSIRILIREQQVAAVPVRAEQLRDEPLFRATRRHAEAHLRLRAIEILAHDHVDHACDRVGPVQRRSAVRQDFNVIDSAPRNAERSTKSASVPEYGCRLPFTSTSVAPEPRPRRFAAVPRAKLPTVEKSSLGPPPCSREAFRERPAQSAYADWRISFFVTNSSGEMMSSTPGISVP